MNYHYYSNQTHIYMVFEAAYISACTCKTDHTLNPTLDYMTHLLQREPAVLVSAASPKYKDGF